MRLIAIDPGIRTGCAILSQIGKLEVAVTMPWQEVAHWAAETMVKDFSFSRESIYVVVECSYLLKARFRAAADKSGWGIRRADMIAGRIVGTLEGIREMLICKEAFYINIREVPPPQHGDRISKVRPALFKAMFPEYDGRTSEHARDAAVLGAWWAKQRYITEMVDGR